MVRTSTLFTTQIIFFFYKNDLQKDYFSYYLWCHNSNGSEVTVTELVWPCIHLYKIRQSIKAMGPCNSQTAKGRRHLPSLTGELTLSSVNWVLYGHDLKDHSATHMGTKISLSGEMRKWSRFASQRTPSQSWTTGLPALCFGTALEQERLLHFTKYCKWQQK